MQRSFDHYHKWLAIPPEQQPPDHYQLLALQRFESDLDVIEAAADQRMTHIRSYQTGPNAELAQQLLNELSAARIVLLNEAKKAAYDQQLRRAQQSETTGAQAELVSEPTAMTPSPLVDLGSLGDLESGNRALPTATMPRKRTNAWTQPLPIVVALAALLLGVASVALVSSWWDANPDNVANNSPPTEPPSDEVDSENEQSPVDSPNSQSPKANIDDALNPEDALREALEILAKRPDDPEANLIAGRHFSLEREDWQRGLAMLAKSSDTALRNLAIDDIARAREESELAKLWQAAAQRQSGLTRQRMLDRAAYWYVESLPKLDESAQPIALRHILTIAEKNSAVGLNESVELLPLVDIDRHKLRGEWERNGDEIGCVNGGRPLLLIPVTARGSYRLELTLTQQADDTIILALPAGLSRFDVHLHGFNGDISQVLQRREPLVRTRPGRLALNQRYTVVVDVQLDGLTAAIDVSLDGQPHLACEATTVSADPTIRPKNEIILGGSGRSKFKVHTMRLTMKSGGLRYLDEDEADDEDDDE